jgi:predicted permease
MRAIRYSFRQLRRNPGFATVAIVTLALGIGATTAIFSVFEGVVLSPLQYLQPDRLAVVLLYNRNLGYPTLLSYPDFLDWRRGSRSFESMAAFKPLGFDLTSPGAAEHLDGMEVSSTFFDTLGVKLALGRASSAEEDRTGGAPAAVISHQLWRDRFGGSREALGKSITLNGTGYTIAGVLPADFHFGDGRAAVFTPIGRGDPLIRGDRTYHNILSMGRLKPQVSMGQAQAEMNTVQQRIDQLYPATERGLGIYIMPLKRLWIGDLSGTLVLLLGAVALVLLIACANVANLLLARAAGRTREFAVRLALGAGRSQVVRQLVAESAVLALIGGTLGITIALWGLSALRALAPDLPRINNVGINVPVLLFTLGVSLASGIGFGLLPALRTSKTDVQTGLKDGNRIAGGQHRALWGTQGVLVMAQVALAVVLLAGGSLLDRSIRRLWNVDPGFDARNLVTFQVGLSPSLNTAEKVRLGYQRLMEHIREAPGVESADITSLVPLGQNDNSGPFWIGARQPASMAEIPRAIYYPAGPDYLRTMHIPLLRGRALTASDDVRSELVVLIDDLLARTYFPNRDPLGGSITMPNWGLRRNVAARVVGVVGHVEQYGLDGAVREKPQIYYSIYQLPDEALPWFRDQVTVVLRTRLPAEAVMPAMQSAVAEAGADQPVYNVNTMQELVAQSIAGHRFPMMLLGAFAALALVLACVGIYGVISYTTAQRAREIGIRIALGAVRRDVLRLVLGQGLRLAVAGVTIGTAAALILVRILPSFSHLLYGVRASDPATFVAVGLALVGAALLACYIPARRAARVDPMDALRQD